MHGGPAIDLFSNGGFEAGNLSNWTVANYLNNGITYPPASVNDLNLVASTRPDNSFARSGPTTESQVPSGLTAAGSTLRFPKYGTYSAVVNESPSGANHNVNSITQQSTTTAADVDPADGLIHVRFVVAPVLQNPGHANNQQPYYYILVTNVTQNTTLFSAFNYSNSAGTPWLVDNGATGGAAVYTNWQAVDVPGTAGSIAIGDTVQVQLIAAGCSLGGHWGEVYLDGFGAFLPGLSVTAHAPQRAAAGANLTTTYAVNNSSSTSETNATVVLPMPSQTTFVSLTAPPGASCTLPPVGGAGNATCNLGTMNPSSSVSVTLVTAISATATGNILNGSYTVASDQSSALLGPLVSTAVAAGTYADLSVTKTDGVGAVAWGQAVQYTIVVSNAGPATATNATVVDNLPAQLTGATWTCSAAAGGSCGAASGTGSINSTVTLPSGASATYLLSANVVAGTGTSRVTNVVNVATSGTTIDPDMTNNRAADTDDIGTVVAVTVTKDPAGTGQGTVVSAPIAINCGPSCTSASSNFATGNLVTLTATAVAGDSFAGWTGACAGTSTTCNLNPTTSVTATAKFVPQNFNITGSAPAGGGTVSCSTPVAHRQSSTCTIAASAGFKLTKLTDNGTDVTASVSANTYTISNVAADHSVVATFLKDLGTACAASSECAGNSCVDGVCCNSACTGQCQACDIAGSVGTCATVSSGAPHGTRTACASDGSACGGSCNGSSATACAYPGATTSCRAASCAAGTQTAAASCGGTGACPAPVTSACTPYLCGATACKTSCTVDTDCIAGDYCSAGACVPKLANGSACTGANQCTSASCVDGVCCNTACSGQCQACDVAGSVGTCATVASGAPHGTRTACASDGSACGGTCNGSSATACAYPGATTSCRAASCSAGTATAAASCAGTGACPAPATTSCNPYVCGATACKTTCTLDTDCIAADYCSAGACLPKLANGAACTGANQCGSANCVDGVCCSSACTGQCQACDVAGSVGTCAPVSGAPHGSRAACATDGTACGGSCDGTAAHAAACVYPTSTCRAASCTAGVATLQASCSGGSCPAVQQQNCSPYVCGPTSCRATCGADSDCIAGDYCSGGVCVPKQANGTTCGAANQCASNNCVDGVCCNTGCAGQCQACNLTGSVGICATVASGAPRGTRPACATDGTACGGSCDGTNPSACTYPTTQCRAPACSNGVATLAANCSAGGCPALQQQNCSPYACGATACLGNCTVDTNCIAGDYCSAGVCTPKVVNGSSCTTANQCQSGNCVDNFCCDTSCSGQCQACDVAGSPGTCTVVTGPPHGTRPACASDGTVCGGSCAGSNPAACSYPTAQCRAASCAANTATLRAACDGAGRCPPPQTQTCPQGCGPTMCVGTCIADPDCAPTQWCSAGVCKPKVSNGASCGADNQCSSGSCVDGVCCNTPCSGQCEACNLAGGLGTCTPVFGPPRGARPACNSDGSACGGACDGSSRTSCAYPSPATQCRAATCSAGVATQPASCDGVGHCPAQTQVSCGAFACGPTACTTACSQDSDCASGALCVSGACHARNDPSIWVVAGTGGCSHGGAATWPLLLLVAAFALRRRARRAAVLGAVAFASVARAQTTAFVVDRFQPGAGAFDVLGVPSAVTMADMDWHGSAYFGYARDPLRLLALGHPDQVQLLHGQSMLHLGGSYGLLDRFEIGAVLPVALQQVSAGAPMLGGNLAAPVPSSGLGDLRVIPKARLWSSEWLTLGAAASFTLPFGRPDAYLGEGAPSFTPTALVELQRWFPLRLLASAGLAVRGGRSLSNLKVTSALTYGVAADVPLSRKLALQATIAGEANLAQGGQVERPMELMGAVRWNVLPGLQLTGGGGPGLTIGYGTPRYRLFLAVALTPELFPPRQLPAQHFASLPDLAPPVTTDYPVRDAYPPVVLVVREVIPDAPQLAKLENDRVDLLAPVLFATNRDVLLVQSRAVLDSAVAVLRAHPELERVQIAGHTDGHGDRAHNLLLSDRRARAVVEYLVKHGIARPRLEYKGFGAGKPIASNKTSEGRARNRRVEMLIVRRASPRSAATESAGDPG